MLTGWLCAPYSNKELLSEEEQLGFTGLQTSNLGIAGAHGLILTGVSLGEIISNVKELQSLSVDPSAEKEKQKADVKHILQQKQRALADLFKMLTEIGASASSEADQSFCPRKPKS